MRHRPECLRCSHWNLKWFHLDCPIFKDAAVTHSFAMAVDGFCRRFTPKTPAPASRTPKPVRNHFFSGKEAPVLSRNRGLLFQLSEDTTRRS